MLDAWARVGVSRPQLVEIVEDRHDRCTRPRQTQTGLVDQLVAVARSGSSRFLVLVLGSIERAGCAYRVGTATKP